MWGRLVSTSVSSVQFAVLASLVRQEPLDQAGLARIIGLDPASAHAVVHRLRASGHLSLERSEQDARRSDLRLTEEGRRLHDELLPLTRHRNDNPFLITTGASFGAYHALTFALRYPHEVGRAIGLSGIYDIREITDGPIAQAAVHPARLLPPEPASSTATR